MQVVMSVELGGEKGTRDRATQDTRNAKPKDRQGRGWSGKQGACGGHEPTHPTSFGRGLYADDPIDRRWAELGWREAKDASLA